jgi:CRP-like cAMP-binding protein
MSEESTETGPITDAGKSTDFTPITTQDDLNKVVSERVARERAKFSDYDAMKAKAAELDGLKAANQTEAEKTAARIAAIETDLSKARQETQRLTIATAHGITDKDDIELFLTGTDAETLTRQAKRLADRDADRKKNGNHNAREGTQTTVKSGDEAMREFARGLFKRAD